jgi:hypothetical protein
MTNNEKKNAFDLPIARDSSSKPRYINARLNAIDENKKNDSVLGNTMKKIADLRTTR